jgi:hypothetical protein
MRTASTKLGAGVVLALCASGAMALGFGSVSNATVLGQPLSFSIPLRMEADEFVAVECVSATVYAGDNRVPPPQVQVALDPARDGAGRVLRVSTTVLIDEPIVTIDLGVGCPVRLSRKFVAFVDPPIVTLAQAAPAEPPRAAEPAAQPAAPAAPPVAVQPTPRPERRAAAPAQRATQPRRARPLARPSTIVAAEAPAPRQRAATAPAARATAPAPAPTPGARLQLEAAQALEPAASAPQAAASAALPVPLVADAAAAAAGASEAQAIERERIRVLEENLARIRSDAEANRNSINALQARLRDEEARRFNNPLVYTLVAVIAALLFAMALLVWWARAREKQRAEWWVGGAEETPSRRKTAPAPAAVSAPAPLTPALAPDSVASHGFVDSTQPAKMPMTWKPTLAIPELDKNEVPKRAVSAEELIDLEQQAEFFITLGQDDSAIDLLVGHLNSAGGTSPLPYLKLMEIHRRRGDLPAYERIREHFNQRFNAYAPPGDAPLAPPRLLEDHPELMAQLQEAWPTPPRAMGLLESLLFKSGEGDAAFDLAAYREVLFLHEVARDLFEHAAAPVTVDVLLPLDDGPESVISTPPTSGMMPFAAQASATQPLPVDLDLGRPRDEEAEQAAARTERRRERYGDDDFQFGSGTGSGFGDLGPGGTRDRKK